MITIKEITVHPDSRGNNIFFIAHALYNNIPVIIKTRKLIKSVSIQSNGHPFKVISITPIDKKHIKKWKLIKNFINIDKKTETKMVNTAIGKFFYDSFMLQVKKELPEYDWEYSTSFKEFEENRYDNLHIEAPIKTNDKFLQSLNLKYYIRLLTLRNKYYMGIKHKNNKLLSTFYYSKLRDSFNKFISTKVKSFFEQNYESFQEQYEAYQNLKKLIPIVAPIEYTSNQTWTPQATSINTDKIRLFITSIINYPDLRIRGKFTNNLHTLEKTVALFNPDNQQITDPYIDIDIKNIKFLNETETIIQGINKLNQKTTIKYNIAKNLVEFAEKHQIKNEADLALLKYRIKKELPKYYIINNNNPIKKLKKDFPDINWEISFTAYAPVDDSFRVHFNCPTIKGSYNDIEFTYILLGKTRNFIVDPSPNYYTRKKIQFTRYSKLKNIVKDQISKVQNRLKRIPEYFLNNYKKLKSSYEYIHIVSKNSGAYCSFEPVTLNLILWTNPNSFYTNIDGNMPVNKLKHLIKTVEPSLNIEESQNISIDNK